MQPSNSISCTQARREAESAGDDAALLHLRQLERSHAGLPPVIDDARRDRLLWSDAISTVWTGWNIHSGARLMLRCLRPYWRDDPVMLRRMGRAAESMPPAVLPLSWCSEGIWPHLRVHLPGPLLSERHGPDPALFAGALVGAIDGLCGLHSSGRWLGGGLLSHLSEGADGVSLIWLDRFDPPGSQVADLSSLALLAEHLDPLGQSPLSRLVQDWQPAPPPSAADAAHLLQRAMSSSLLASRHQLLASSRRHGVHLLRLSLASQVRSLLRLPLPRLRTCLSAPEGGMPTIVISDGHTLRAGATAEAALPVVATSDGDLDVTACRSLLRAARRHQARDEARRALTERQLGGEPSHRAAVVRWLVSRIQLRSLSLLLERQLSPQSRSSSASR